MPEVGISIIVPVYNVERYLSDCLDSLCLQDMEEVEVICIDDGSTDGSASILGAYARENEMIRVVTQENAGVASARNRGIRLARGEYILFVDSDDLIDSHTCSYLYEIAKKDNSEIVVFGGKTFPTLPWADASFSACRRVYKKGVRALFDEQGSIPLMCNKLYSRSFIERHSLLFCENLSLGEDHAFQMVAFPYAKKVSFVDERLYFYRIRNDSAVGANGDDASRRTWKHFDVVQYVFEEWNRRGFMKKWPSDIFSWAINFISNSYFDCRFNEKRRFAREFIPYIKKCADSRSAKALSLDESVLHKLRSIEQYGGDLANPPVFTIVVDCIDGYKEKYECLKSLAYLNEPSIEIILLVDDSDKDPASSYGEMDERVKVLSSKSPREVLACMSGSYLLVVDVNAVFGRDSLGDLVPLLTVQNGGESVSRHVGYSDIIIFADALNATATHSFFDFAQPLTCESFVDEELHGSDDFGEYLLSFAGLFSCNKLIGRQIVEECLDQEKMRLDSWLDFQICAMLHACKILPTKWPLFGLYSLGASDSCPSKQIVDRLSILIRTLDSENMLEGKAKVAFYEASIEYLIMVSWLSGPDCGRGVFLKEFQSFARKAPDTCFRKAQDCQTDKFFRMIKDGLFDQYIREVVSFNSMRLAREAGKYRLQAIDEGRRANRIACEFGNSVSYRFGKIATALPRAVFGKLKCAYRKLVRRKNGLI